MGIVPRRPHGRGESPTTGIDLGRTDLGRTDLGRTDLGRTDLGRTDRGRTDLATSQEVEIAIHHGAMGPDPVTRNLNGITERVQNGVVVASSTFSPPNSGRKPILTISIVAGTTSVDVTADGEKVADLNIPLSATTQVGTGINQTTSSPSTTQATSQPQPGKYHTTQSSPSQHLQLLNQT
jgi:hypothetical protein